jgi:hypothetical protein
VFAKLKALFPPEVLFFLVVWLGLTARFQRRAFQDPGALWHIRVGDLILDRGFMTTDPFTYTFTGQTWIPQQWGGEVLMSLAHRFGGFDTVLHLYTAMMAFTFTWVFSRMVRNGLHPVLASVLVLGAVVITAFHFYARPHIVTIVGMVVTMTALLDYERGRASLWRLWWLIPFNIVWTNIHGGVLGGVLTMGLAVVGWIGWSFLHRRSTLRVESAHEHDSESRATLARQEPRPPKTWRTAIVLCGLVAACGLTPFVNPFGMEMLNTWRKIVSSNAMKELVSEHQPLSLQTTCGQAVVGYVVFYLFALLGTLPKWPRVTWLLPLVWFVLSLKGIRQGPLFTAIAVVAIADIWPHTVWHRLLKKYGDSLARETEPTRRPWTWAWVCGVLVGAALILQAAKVPVPVVGHGWARLDSSAIPTELTDAINNHPSTGAIFNDANLGGYMIYHAPGRSIFMDDRFELYGDDWMRAYADVVYDHPEKFADWTKQYGFELAVVSIYPGEHRLPLEKWLRESPEWKVSKECDAAVLFERRR